MGSGVRRTHRFLLALSAYSVYADNLLFAYSAFEDNCLSAYILYESKWGQNCLKKRSKWGQNYIVSKILADFKIFLLKI